MYLNGKIAYTKDKENPGKKIAKPTGKNVMSLKLINNGKVFTLDQKALANVKAQKILLDNGFNPPQDNLPVLALQPDGPDGKPAPHDMYDLMQGVQDQGEVITGPFLNSTVYSTG